MQTYGQAVRDAIKRSIHATGSDVAWRHLMPRHWQIINNRQLFKIAQR